MFYDTELAFLQKALKKSHLPSVCLSPTLPPMQHLDLNVALFFDTAEATTFYDIFPETRAHTVYRATDAFYCRCIFLKLPTGGEDTVLFIGPYLHADFTHQQILELGESLSLPPHQVQALEAFYATLPIVREEHHVLALVSAFAERLWNGEENYEYVELNHQSPLSLPPIDDIQQADGDVSLQHMQMMEKRYSYENELMTAVAAGNLNKAELMMAGFSSLAFEERVPDRLRNMKNYSIVMNTLFRKAAEQGGVHPVYIDRVSSHFAKKIENIHTLTAIQQLMPEILRAYCRLVKQHAVRKYSPVIQKAMVKIESDLAGDLTLHAVAVACNVSAGYLSGLFKKETGETLTAFVTEKRIAHAKHLLRSTSLQVQTIAQHCGILDLHYFCKLFKDATGKTPTAYRSQSI